MNSSIRVRHIAEAWVVTKVRHQCTAPPAGRPWHLGHSLQQNRTVNAKKRQQSFRLQSSFAPKFGRLYNIKVYKVVEGKTDAFRPIISEVEKVQALEMHAIAYR